MLDRGYIWLAHGEMHAELSQHLARSLKKFNKESNICVITDHKGSPVLSKDKNIDHLKVLRHSPLGKFEPEWRVFDLSPFTHTIKLEADMLMTNNTDWWWNLLHQWDMVHSYHCRNYRDDVVRDTPYRKLFRDNHLPDVYSGLTYFRKSLLADKFFKLCRLITESWKVIKHQCLINCHDDEPTTDVVYALANKMIDPLQEKKIEYDWFKFTHNKNGVNGLPSHIDNKKFLQFYQAGDAVYLGGFRQSRLLHYHDKDLLKEFYARNI